jgi:hypothetical protein
VELSRGRVRRFLRSLRHAWRRVRSPNRWTLHLRARAIRNPGFSWPILSLYCKLAFERESSPQLACFEPMLKFPLRWLRRPAFEGLVRSLLPVFLVTGAIAGALACTPAPAAATGATAGADVSRPSTTWAGPGLQFAVADFDGDHRPDLVGVQAGQGSVARTNYWIQLRLSAAGQQTISLVAPSGGLQIAARDVNGDRIPDLILTTTWLGQPVAIFINDGHGTFTRAEPSAFPEAFRKSPSRWNGAADQAADAVGVPPPSRAGVCIAVERFPHAGSNAGTASPARPEIVFSPFLFSHPGRAPPCAVPHL